MLQSFYTLLSARWSASNYGASYVYGAHKQIIGVLKARSQCWPTQIANDDARLPTFVNCKQKKQKQQEE